MNVRRAKIDDLQRLAELWWEMHNFNSNFDDRYYETKPKDECIEWKYGFFEEIINNPDHFIWVAEDNNNVVGYVYVQILERPPIFKYNRIAKVQEASITKEYQQKGLFKQSWNTILNEIKDKNIKMAELEIDLNNPAHFAYWKVNFYKRLWHMICFFED